MRTGRYTGIVFERNFQISKKIFRNKWNIIMTEVCGYETTEKITTKERTTVLFTNQEFKKAVRLRKNFELIEGKNTIKSLNELIRKVQKKSRL